MLHKTLFILSFLLIVPFVNAQTTGVVGNVDVVKETPVLKALADRVNVAHVELTKNATGSRTTTANAQANYNSALNAYLTELEHQLTLGNSRNEAALKSEITLTKQLHTGTSTTTTR